jgi:peptide/nickel transport system substrate-binding protein
MQRTPLRLLAAASAALLVAQPLLAVAYAPGVSRAYAAERPRYGGTLRVQMQAFFQTPDPTAEVGDSVRKAAQAQLAELVYDRLVRLDSELRPQPQLAISWQHDPEYRQWQFRLRAGVKFHDGRPLTPSDVVRALAEASVMKRAGNPPDRWVARIFGETVVIETSRPRPDFLYELAQGHGSIFRRTPDGTIVGTGPFVVREWEPERRALLVANEEYWGGRAYLDNIEIQMGRAPREQMTALELGEADVAEIPAEQVRGAGQRGTRVWSSAPVEMLALHFIGQGTGSTERAPREALALSIDRTAMLRGLFQGQGEVADGLLPQWLSGYAFLFARQRDLENARRLAAETPAGTVVLGYDPADAMGRPVAERVALNARDAGLTIRVVELDRNAWPPKADWILRRVHVAAGRERTGVADKPGTAGGERFPLAAAAFTDEFLGEERELMQNVLFIPLFHLPDSLGLNARVRGWMPAQWGAWRLADVWLAGEEKKEGSETR